ncbi:hypothetical protein PENTCL1PPCAC_15995 [Pristionchus entomophagus]|uniref:Uncharacterized protein n=1 Tax=Pristionchus entomophagus TaxID=358040 RepID=A0AAV5THJ8_9BILA|nr:hypothetical protein PENTCL1PPCAC_15995 [Pristionchus entomophagus]
MRVQPTGPMEKQSDFFAKASMPFHMCAVTARINGELVTHAFGHVSGIPTQDALAVAGIIKHVLTILKANGITHVHIRSGERTQLYTPLLKSITLIFNNIYLI